MKNSLHPIARFAAILFTILFVVTAVAALLLFNLGQRGFNANTYKTALARTDFYQRMPSLLGQVLADETRKNQTPFVQQLTAGNWATIIQTLLPPGQLQALTEEGLTQIFAYLNGEVNAPQISLLPLKQRLSGPAGMNAVVTLIHDQPDCSIEQLAQLINSSGEVLCNPPQDLLDLAKPILQTQLYSLAAALPDRVPLAVSGDASVRARNLRFVRLLMQLSPLIPLAFLFGVTFLAVRTFKGWLAWWGWPLFLTGVLGSVAGFSSAPLFRTAIENAIIRNAGFQLSPENLDAVRSLMDAVLRQIFQPAGWQGLMLAVLSAGMLILVYVLSQKEKVQRVDPSEAETQVMP